MPQRSTSTSATPTLSAIAAQAVQLSKVDRLELMAILQAYNDAEELAAQDAEAREQAKQQALARRGIRGGCGSFEDKYIRGYGPYRYLRYWYGKTHKSVYLGKVKDSDASRHDRV
jgi:hypothetical protein